MQQERDVDGLEGELALRDAEGGGDPLELGAGNVLDRIEAVVNHQVPGVGGPREVVDAVLDEPDRQDLAFDPLVDHPSGGADRALVACR